MVIKKILAKYPCKQTELYAAVTSYIFSTNKYIARFAAHNTQYNAANMASLQIQLDSAMALPNFQQRNQPSETLRVQLEEQTDICLNRWRAMRTYVERAYEGEYLKPMLEAAGQSYLSKAINKNWEEVRELIESGSEFLAAHEAELAAVGMPPTFRTEYDVQFATFNGYFNLITGSVQDQHELTNEKLIANNALYDVVIGIGKDAAVIFHTPEEVAIRERFVFTKVLEVISGSGPARLVGTVTDTANNPLGGVEVILETLDVEIATNEDGTYDSGNIPSGDYKLKFRKAGFVDVEMSITINKGVTKTQNAVLTAE